MTKSRKFALLIIDVQNDFIDGSLSVRKPKHSDPNDYNSIESVINRINHLCNYYPDPINCNNNFGGKSNKSELVFDLIVTTKDWHPANHISFFENLTSRQRSIVGFKPNSNKIVNICVGDADNISKINLFDKVTFRLSSKAEIFGKNHDGNRRRKEDRDSDSDDSGSFDYDQIMWPAHCIQNSWGAELHPLLQPPPGDTPTILKGQNPQKDSYSGFEDDNDALLNLLDSHGITDILCCGVATEVCVGETALDGIKKGFNTFVVQDCSAGICDEAIAVKLDEFVKAGGTVINTSDIPQILMDRNG